MNLLRKLQHLLDIRRLERRYTRRAHRSTKWADAAIYVDGEYVYPSSSSPVQSSSTPSSSTVSPTWTSSLAALAGYGFDPVAAGARLNERGDGKGVGKGEGEGIEMSTWRGKGQKAKGKGVSVREQEGENGRKRTARARREGPKGKPSSATATASPTYTSTLASLAGYCYDPVAAGAYVNERGEYRRVARAGNEGEAEARRTWRGRAERGKRNGKGNRARIRVWVRQVVGR